MGSPITILSKSDSDILQGGAVTSETIYLIADSDYSLKATFVPKEYTLTVLAGEGGSLKDANPSGSYEHGAQVDISASKSDNEHYAFSGWRGSGITDSSDRNTNCSHDRGQKRNRNIFSKTLYH